MDPHFRPIPAHDPEEADIDWKKVKDISIHAVAEPIVAGTFFAFVWLGTFYLLKKQFNL